VVEKRRERIWRKRKRGGRKMRERKVENEERKKWLNKWVELKIKIKKKVRECGIGRRGRI
jgi:transcription initiation factor TFIID subunit TAF12